MKLLSLLFCGFFLSCASRHGTTSPVTLDSALQSKALQSSEVSTTASLEALLHEKVGQLKSRNWGPAVSGLKAALYSWVEPSTPRIHYLLTVKNFAAATAQNFLTPKSRLHLHWINRGMAKPVLTPSGATLPRPVLTSQSLGPGEQVHIYLGATTCKSRFQFMNYRQISAGLTLQQTLNTWIEPLNITGIRCETDTESATGITARPNSLGHRTGYGSGYGGGSELGETAEERWRSGEFNNAPKGQTIAVDESKLPELFFIKIFLRSPIYVTAAKATLTVTTPGGISVNEEVVLKFKEQVCYGCDPIVGGGAHQCKNPCETRSLHQITVRAFGADPSFLLEAGKYKIKIHDFKPLCGNACREIYDRGYGVCDRNTPCDANSASETGMTRMKMEPFVGEFEMRLPQ